MSKIQNLKMQFWFSFFCLVLHFEGAALKTSQVIYLCSIVPQNQHTDTASQLVITNPSALPSP